MAKDFSLHSGERLATIDPPVIYPDHLARDQFVCDDMKQRGYDLFGADIFCGAGYGTNLLAETLDGTVLGIDGSAEATVPVVRRIANMISGSVRLRSRKRWFQPRA